MFPSYMAKTFRIFKRHCSNVCAKVGLHGGNCAFVGIHRIRLCTYRPLWGMAHNFQTLDRTEKLPTIFMVYFHWSAHSMIRMKRFCKNLKWIWYVRIRKLRPICYKNSMRGGSQMFLPFKESTVMRSLGSQNPWIPMMGKYSNLWCGSILKHPLCIQQGRMVLCLSELCFTIITQEDFGMRIVRRQEAIRIFSYSSLEWNRGQHSGKQEGVCVEDPSKKWNRHYANITMNSWTIKWNVSTIVSSIFVPHKILRCAHRPKTSSRRSPLRTAVGFATIWWRGFLKPVGPRQTLSRWHRMTNVRATGFGNRW